MRIEREKLLIIAGAFWLIAGGNVALIGFVEAVNYSGWKLALIALGAFLTFALFHVRIFAPMDRKNEARIRNCADERQNPLRFLDKRGYIIMLVMMALGFGGRALGLFPSGFIAFFYSGLGLALAVTGLASTLRYFGKELSCCRPRRHANSH